jgi:exodeoxyribonuclease V beta subunit
LTRNLLDPANPTSTRDHDSDREVDTEKLQLDEPHENSTQTASAWQAFGAGARYGTALHDLLQWQADRDWPLAVTGPSAAWNAMIERQSGLTDAERAMVTPWIQQIIQTPLPIEGARPLVLADLRQPQQMAEMPFHFGVETLSVQRMDAMISADLFVGMPRASLMPVTLGGMVNGFMDLVFEHDGRYWVLDYKSNLLDRYDSTSLQAALLEKRYDIQSVLYLLALHRLLKVRLPDYDPAWHLGGAVYVFIRGIGTPGQGVVMQQPSAQLIIALDRAMGGQSQEAA